MRVHSIPTASASQLLLLFLMASLTVIAAQNDGSVASSCPLDCSNGGICQKGSADFSIHPTEPNGVPFLFLQETSHKGWFCNCTDLWTGIRCGRQYTVCPTNAGDEAHICYDGGICIEGMEDNGNITSSQRFCDCSQAFHGGVPYFGKYCEIPGAVQCAADSSAFCTAQGTCKEGFETLAHPCDCPEGHRGPHCEFLRGQVPDCVLNCTNGGECTLGIKDFEVAKYENFWQSHDGNYQYCTCPKDWFGDSCEVPGVQCGNAHCFNGATCLRTLNSNHESTFACDCRTANHNGKAYAGQYCEAEATVTCANVTNLGNLHPNGHLFCTNNGMCGEEAHLGCECPAGRHGSRCEFHNAEDATCTLECQNGGSCQKGKKDNSLINSLGPEMAQYNITHSQLFEHCVCPDGYFGIQCEHKLEICPGGDHVCLHGSKCVAIDEGEGGKETSHKCDCEDGFDAVERYAGKFCQYTSTDICTKNGQPGVGKANFAFCVNNGLCKSKVESNEPHPGCICEEGFTGDHCEFLLTSGSESATGSAASASTTSSSGVDEANQSAVVATSTILVVIIAIVGFVVFRSVVRGGRKANRGKTAAEAEAAIAEAEKEVDGLSMGSGQQPFDEGVLPRIAPAQFDEDDGNFEDVDDYSNDQSDTSTLTEDDMTNIQIV